MTPSPFQLFERKQVPFKKNNARSYLRHILFSNLKNLIMTKLNLSLKTSLLVCCFCMTAILSFGQTNCENLPCGGDLALPFGPDACDSKLYCSNSNAVDNGFIACTPSADTDGCGVNPSLHAIPPAGSDTDILLDALDSDCYSTGDNVQWIRFMTNDFHNQFKIQGVGGPLDAWAVFWLDGWTYDPINDPYAQFDNPNTCYPTNGDLTPIYCTDANQWTIVTNPSSTEEFNLYYIALIYSDTGNGTINFKSKECEFKCSPPVISCPANAAIECDEPTGPDNTGYPTHSFGCGVTNYTFTDSSDGMTCPETITRTWTVTDNDGNTDTCDQVITVDDTTDPVINCPADYAVQCIEDVPACDPDDAVATDNCGMPNVTCSNGPLVGGECGGTVTVTYTATDDCGNTATCTQVITVDDTTNPMITCPADYAVQCIEDVPACDPDDAVATDNCGEVYLTCSNGPLVGGECGGTVTVTYTATDDCGNTATCTQVITVDDTTDPMITCPDDVTDLSCIGDIPCSDDVELTTTDNCDMDVDVTLIADTGHPDCVDGLFSRTYTFEATDDCGNTATCSVTYSGTCQDLCTFTQGAWGNSGGAPGSVFGTTDLDILETLFTSFGPLELGLSGNSLTIEINEWDCIDDLLPGGGMPGPLGAGDNGLTNCVADNNDPLNNLATNVVALQLNVWLNVTYNGLLLADVLNQSLDCINISTSVSATTIGELLDEANACLGDPACSNGGDLVAAVSGVNEYWDECEVSDPCSANGNSAENIEEGSFDLEKAKELSQVLVIPNPITQNEIRLLIYSEVAQQHNIRVLNSSGIVFINQQLNLEEGWNNVRLEAQLNNGVYFVQAKTPDGSNTVTRFVKIK